jgi:Na+/H+ antiporter NhaD/arsenite permease-like protein
LTFEDFIIKAMPLAVLCLLGMIGLVLVLYRKPIAVLRERMRALGDNDILIRLISVPPDQRLRIGLTIFGVTLILIALHHRLELMWGLAENTVLLVLPLISSGGVMIWKWQKARSYIERDVEWWTLLFFLLLFAQAGTLKYTGATDVLAQKIVRAAGQDINVLTGAVLWLSAIGSSILDNVVLVAAFIPIIQGFQNAGVDLSSLWWALLFGGCLGGNITLVGSTANIVAIGILEKEKNIRVSFFTWFWVGLTVGIVTTLIVWVALMVLPIYR